MGVSIQFFGVAAYLITTATGKRVLIDPFLDKNQYSPVKSDDLEPIDLLLITHNASDHFGDAAKIVNEHQCPVVCAMDVLHHLVRYHGISRDLFRVTIWGMAIEESGVWVRPVESRHWSFAVAPDGTLLSGPAMGFVVDAGDGVRIYHPGDTALTGDMKLWGELYQPTVGLMHVTLPEGEGVSLPHMECYRSGELTPHEAYLASRWMGLDHIVVSHYVDSGCEDVNRFLEIVRAADHPAGFSPKVTVMAPGEVLGL